MREIWKDIPGFEGRYQVSSNGRIKSLSRYRNGKKGAKTYCAGRIMRLTQMTNGYLQIGLSKDKFYRVYLVHRLVALAFISNNDKHKCVDHINGVRHDNRVENLRWCSHSQNLSFSLAKINISKSSQISEKCKQHRKVMIENHKRPIVIVYPSGRVVEYSAAVDAEKDGFNHSLIAACCRGKQKTHRKCKCYYKEDYYGD